MNENAATENMELHLPSFKVEMRQDGLFVGSQTTDGKYVASS